MIVSGVYERSFTNGRVQCYNFCFEMKLELTPCPMPRKTVKPKYFISDTLAQTFNIRCSALTGAAIIVLALVEPFIAAGAAVAFLVLFSYRKRTRPPRI